MATQVGTKLAFCDTETTGLDPDRHEIWEVGLILREEDGRETQHHWFLPVDLGRADAFALNIGHFHERHPDGGGVPKGTDVYTTFLGEFARDFADLTRGAHLVGAVVSFDAERLTKLLRAKRCPPRMALPPDRRRSLSAVGYISRTRVRT